MFFITEKLQDFGFYIMKCNDLEELLDMKTKRLKKMLLFTVVLTLSVFLPSCNVHFGEQHYEVHWWVIAIPVVLIFTLAHCLVIKKKYQCPKCKAVFRPRWYEISTWVPVGEERVVKCPKCHRKGFCRYFNG